MPITPDEVRKLRDMVKRGVWNHLPPMKDGVVTDEHDWYGIMREHMSMTHATAKGIGNAELISALPEIVDLCLEQDEKLKGLREKIEDLKSRYLPPISSHEKGRVEALDSVLLLLK